MTVPLHTLDAGATFRFAGETWRVVTWLGESVMVRDDSGALIVFAHARAMQVTLVRSR